MTGMAYRPEIVYYDGAASQTLLRDKLRNKIRRASPEDKITLRGQKAILTTKITDLREQLKLNQGIEIRSAGIRDTWSQFIVNEERGHEKEKQARKERGAKEREIM